MQNNGLPKWLNVLFFPFREQNPCSDGISTTLEALRAHPFDRLL